MTRMRVEAKDETGVIAWLVARETSLRCKSKERQAYRQKRGGRSLTFCACPEAITGVTRARTRSKRRNKEEESEGDAAYACMCTGAKYERGEGAKC